MVAGSLVTGFCGYGASVLASMFLGIRLHQNYEYFDTGILVGNLLLFGGAAIGFAIPWIIPPAIRKFRDK